jgi:hypothetical protein
MNGWKMIRSPPVSLDDSWNRVDVPTARRRRRKLREHRPHLLNRWAGRRGVKQCALAMPHGSKPESERIQRVGLQGMDGAILACN